MATAVSIVALMRPNVRAHPSTSGTHTFLFCSLPTAGIFQVCASGLGVSVPGATLCGVVRAVDMHLGQGVDHQLCTPFRGAGASMFW